MDPDEQPFQIVFTALFKFTTLNVNVFKPDLFVFHQALQVETQRCNVCSEFFLCFLERYKHARFVVLRCSTDDKLHSKEGLSAARTAAHERRSPFRQSSVRNLIETFDPCWSLGEFFERNMSIQGGHTSPYSETAILST